MSALIYVETTIPSFYCETRCGLEIESRRKWTRRWWDLQRPNERRVTSSLTVQELERIPDAERRDQAVALIHALEKLDYTKEVAETWR